MTLRFPPGSGDWVNCDATKQEREKGVRASSNDFVLCRGMCMSIDIRVRGKNSWRSTYMMGETRGWLSIGQ